MILEIQQWMAGTRDYKTGVAIVNKFSQSVFLKKMLASGETPFNKQKLLQAMVELNKDSAIAPKPVTRTEIMTEAEYREAPLKIKKKKHLATELNKLNGKRHSQLYTYLCEARRLFEDDLVKMDAYFRERHVGDIANSILDTDDELAQLYFEIDFFKIHKKLPEEMPDMALNFAQKFELRPNLTNARSRISKLKRKIENLQGTVPLKIDLLKKKREELLKEEKYRDDLERRLHELA